MGRPPLKRRIARLPEVTFFKPAGIRARDLDQVGLGVDEVEALRLVDLEGLSQERAAEELGVSRQTVGRIVDEARRKVADALVNGKAVVIDGGAYALAAGRFCADCGAYWSQGSTVVDEATGQEQCPACGSSAVRVCPGGGRGRGCGARRRQGAASAAGSGAGDEPCRGGPSARARRCEEGEEEDGPQIGAPQAGGRRGRGKGSGRRRAHGGADAGASRRRSTEQDEKESHEREQQ